MKGQTKTVNKKRYIELPNVLSTILKKTQQIKSDKKITLQFTLDLVTVSLYEGR